MTLDDLSVDDIMRMNGLEATGLADLREPSVALDCPCICHTRRFSVPTADVHDEGRTCPCQLTDEERRAQDVSYEEWLAAFRQSGDGRALTAAIEADRTAALERARRRGMQILIECDLEPTIVSGCYEGRRFWFCEQHGNWALHLDQVDGPVVAQSRSAMGLADVIDLIWDRLDRHIRTACEHVVDAAVFCGGCGQRVERS